jgi:hypothetical protein
MGRVKKPQQLFNLWAMNPAGVFLTAMRLFYII